MKKTYQKPETLDIRVELQQMIALSKMDGNANDSDALSREMNDFEDDAAASRRKNVWDDDEEEEDNNGKW